MKHISAPADFCIAKLVWFDIPSYTPTWLYVRPIVWLHDEKLLENKVSRTKPVTAVVSLHFLTNSQKIWEVHVKPRRGSAVTHRSLHLQIQTSILANFNTYGSVLHTNSRLLLGYVNLMLSAYRQKKILFLLIVCLFYSWLAFLLYQWIHVLSCGSIALGSPFCSTIQTMILSLTEDRWLCMLKTSCVRIPHH